MTRRFVGGLSREMLRSAFVDWFGVQDNHADLLVVLFERQGRPATCKQLGALLSAHRPLNPGAVWERVRVLRQAMESECVDHDDDKGYSLTEVGTAECRRALRSAAEALIRHGYELPHVEGQYEFVIEAKG